MKTFTELLADAVRDTIAKMKRQGTVSCSYSTLVAMLPTGKLAHLPGAPSGTNARWHFGGILRGVVRTTPRFASFVTDVPDY